MNTDGHGSGTCKSIHGSDPRVSAFIRGCFLFSVPLRLCGGLFLSAALGAPALAQPSNIDPAHKHAWAGNLGYLDCRDADSGAQGVVVHLSYLSGYAWLGNAGWVRMGTPSGPTGTCGQYPPPASQTGANYGVNIAGGGDLSGYAWGANIGWVNFSTAGVLPAGQRARLDRAGKRLRGYAWGANVGWINLDDATVYVATTLCTADADGNGAVQAADVAAFVNAWFCSLQNGTLAGDLDGDGAVAPADIAMFVNLWFQALVLGTC